MLIVLFCSPVEALKTHQKDGYNWLMARVANQMGSEGPASPNAEWMGPADAPRCVAG